MSGAQRGLQLTLISLTEFGTPLLRMLVLSHTLSLQELGIASILTATYGGFETVTDFAISRFLFSVGREHFSTALGAAHGLSIVRGLFVCLIATAAAPFIADIVQLHDYSLTFAALAPALLIRSLEHLGPRVSERNYIYGAQFKAALISNGLAFAAVTAYALTNPTHNALIVLVYVQNISYVAATHILAAERYAPTFFNDWFRKAMLFGLPLMANGVGTALSYQGDRFVIGALISLSDLGIYSIAILATTIPLTMLSRVTGTILLAAIYNAHASPTEQQLRVKFAALFMPAINALVEISLVFLLNFASSIVFGARFVFSPEMVCLLTLGAFFRGVRTDPFGSILLHHGLTKKIAVSNLTSISSLIFAFGLGYHYRSLDSMLAGRLIGEFIAYVATVWVSRREMAGSLEAHFFGMAISFATLIASCAIYVGGILPPHIAYNFVAVAAFGLILAIYSLFVVVPVWKRAFPGVAARLLATGA